jgi:hypothetical protein
MSVDEEWRRLQGLYAAMSDDELLELARDKAELTEVAQQAVEAEMGSRGLKLDEEEQEKSVEPIAYEFSTSEDDPSLIELMTFHIATDAETALHALDDHGIPVSMEPAMRRLNDDGPRIKTNWLTIFVERTRQRDAVKVLRERMGLFPVLAADEVEDADVVDDEDESLFTVGEFEVDADAEVARKALTDAGIWFKAGKETQEAQGGQAAFDGTVIEVRLEDLERALGVVEEAFGEEDPN